MAEIIRKIEEKDFQAVSDLYNGRKSVEELQWLFTNPDDSNSYNAFVAVKNKDQVIGVIGYILSAYTQNNTELLGSIPISWKLISEYKGMAGVLLFKKVMTLGDFGFTIAGSETAKDLYKLFKYKHVSRIDQYYKILNPQKAFKSLNRKSIIKTIGMFDYLLPSYLKKTKHSSDNINFIKYVGSNFIKEQDSNAVFKKEITKNYIDWLLDCPLVKTYAFTIKKEELNIGVCVLYIKEMNGLRKGRIVHLPYMEKDLEIRESVIKKCISFFKEEKCCIIDGLAHNIENQTAYSESGFITIKKHYKPLYIKDANQLMKNMNVKNWLLQYSEGDKAYRSF